MHLTLVMLPDVAWDVSQGALSHSHESINHRNSLVFSLDMNLLTAASDMQLSGFEVWDATRDQLHTYKSVEHGTCAVVFSPDGDSVATLIVDAKSGYGTGQMANSRATCGI